VLKGCCGRVRADFCGTENKTAGKIFYLNVMFHEKVCRL
jgi:hypothetical protein